MADPLTIGLGIGSLLGIGGSLLSKGGGSSTPSLATSATPPNPSTPAIAPGTKPGQKSQQQSFLSGAAALQGSGGFGGGGSSGSGGKSLLGQ